MGHFDRTSVQLVDGEWWYVKDGVRRARATLVVCATCGKEFGRQPGGTTRFCSQACWRKPCAACGQLFAFTTNLARFCSPACQYGVNVCEECGETFTPVKNALGRFCSKECHFESKAPTGSRRVHAGSGYIMVKVPVDTPGGRVGGGKSRWMFEHRYVMQQAIGRSLERHESVHHMNGRRDDNDIANLELWKVSQPAGVRSGDYHCPGCTCPV